MRHLRWVPFGIVLLIAVAASLQCALTESSPSIILVTLDTTRADHLGCYGSERASTPHLDRLAQDSALFSNAVTTVPLTLPSHASIMTGHNPPQHGVRNNGAFILAPIMQTVAEDLQRNGYTTAAFVSCFVLNRQFGLAQGFDAYDDSLAAEERPAAETTRRALRWLENAAEEPLFLWVHYFDPHSPYAPPEPFASATRGTPYDAEISSMDAGLGDLLNGLKQRGIYDNAHVIVLADHGEGRGDHREQEHGIFLYEDCLRIPFLWKLPGDEQAQRVESLVGCVDVSPTILDFAGIAAPNGIAGQSLRGLLMGGQPPDRTGLYAETMYPFYSYEWSPLYAWRTEEWKYIQAPAPELYNLTDDPAEQHNRVADFEEKAAELGKLLRNARLRGGTDQTMPSEASIDPAVAEKLASLGYVWSGGTDKAPPPDSLPDPKSQIAYHERFEEGKLAISEGRPEDAIPAFEALLAAYPNNHTATYLMGLALLKVGRAEEALVWLTRHIERGEDPSATLAMGQALLELGRPEEALTWLGKHLEAGSQKTAALEHSGDALSDLGRLEAALQAYRRASEQTSSARLIWKEARALVQLGRFAEAETRMAEGARLAPPEDHVSWGSWTAAVGQLCQHGIEHPAASPEALATQVRAAAQLGLYSEARQLIEASRAAHSSAMLMALRGDVAVAEEDWPAAASAYERAEALGIEPNAQHYLKRAMTRLRMNDLSGAAQLLREGIQEGPDPGGLLRYNLACALARAGDMEGALEALAAAREHGYPRMESAREDPDLAPLLGHEDFERLTRAGD